jgi:hypothetical protein
MEIITHCIDVVCDLFARFINTSSISTEVVVDSIVNYVQQLDEL